MFVTIGVSGAFLVIDALGVTMFEGKKSVLDSSSTVGPVAGARPVDGSTMRETGGITRHPQKGEAGNRNLEPTVGIYYPSGAEPHKRTSGQVKKSPTVDASFKMMAGDFTNRTHA